MITLSVVTKWCAGEERSEERQDVPATKTPHLNSDDLTGYFVDCLAKKHKLDEEIDLDEEEEEDSKEPMESADDNQTGNLIMVYLNEFVCLLLHRASLLSCGRGGC